MKKGTLIVGGLIIGLFLFIKSRSTSHIGMIIPDVQQIPQPPLKIIPYNSISTTVTTTNTIDVPLNLGTVNDYIYQPRY